MKAVDLNRIIGGLGQNNERLDKIYVNSAEDFLEAVEKVSGKIERKKNVEATVASLCGVELIERELLPDDIIVLKTDKRCMALHLGHMRYIEIHDDLKDFMSYEFKLK